MTTTPTGRSPANAEYQWPAKSRPSRPNPLDALSLTGLDMSRIEERILAHYAGKPAPVYASTRPRTKEEKELDYLYVYAGKDLHGLQYGGTRTGQKEAEIDWGAFRWVFDTDLDARPFRVPSTTLTSALALTLEIDRA